MEYVYLHDEVNLVICKVKVSRDRPRWPKGFRVKAPDFFDVSELQGW